MLHCVCSLQTFQYVTFVLGWDLLSSVHPVIHTVTVRSLKVRRRWAWVWGCMVVCDALATSPQLSRGRGGVRPGQVASPSQGNKDTSTPPHLQPKPESELGMVFFELWYKTRICVGIYTLLEYLFFYFLLLHSAFLHSFLYFLLLTLSGICYSPSLHTFKNQTIKTIVLACPSLLLIVHNEKKVK